MPCRIANLTRPRTSLMSSFKMSRLRQVRSARTNGDARFRRGKVGPASVPFRWTTLSGSPAAAPASAGEDRERLLFEEEGVARLRGDDLDVRRVLAPRALAQDLDHVRVDVDRVDRALTRSHRRPRPSRAP